MSLTMMLSKQVVVEEAPPEDNYPDGEVYILDDDDGTIAAAFAAAGYDGPTIRTNVNDHEEEIVVGSELDFITGNDNFFVSGGFTLAADSKRGVEIEILECPTGGGVDPGVDDILFFIGAQFQSMGNLSPAGSRYLEVAFNSAVQENLSANGTGGYADSDVGLDRTEILGKRIGLYLNAAANAGLGSFGWTLDGVDQGQISTFIGDWTVGDRITFLLRFRLNAAAGATTSGSLKVRCRSFADNMDGGGMPAATLDIGGNAIN